MRRAFWEIYLENKLGGWGVLSGKAVFLSVLFFGGVLHGGYPYLSCFYLVGVAFFEMWGLRLVCGAEKLVPRPLGEYKSVLLLKSCIRALFYTSAMEAGYVMTIWHSREQTFRPGIVLMLVAVFVIGFPYGLFCGILGGRMRVEGVFRPEGTKRGSGLYAYFSIVFGAACLILSNMLHMGGMIEVSAWEGSRYMALEVFVVAAAALAIIWRIRGEYGNIRPDGYYTSG